MRCEVWRAVRYTSQRDGCLGILNRDHMPFYEYQCKSCSHELEAMQKVSESPLKKCPQCGKSQLQRLMSAPVFRLKGGGWYETDFKDDKDNKNAIWPKSLRAERGQGNR